MENKIKFLKDDIRVKIKKLLKDVEKGVDYLYEIATTEEKTGLYNYRFFKSVLNMELEKTKRNNKKMSVVMMDLDHFKKVNDNYGHLVGDKVLIRFAKLLTKGLRKYDTLCRFGGEEFLVLMPNTPALRANNACKRITNLLKNDSIMKKYCITFSAGITEYKKNDGFNTLKKRADKALYKAKNTGRNKMVIG